MKEQSACVFPKEFTECKLDKLRETLAVKLAACEERFAELGSSSSDSSDSSDNDSDDDGGHHGSGSGGNGIGDEGEEDLVLPPVVSDPDPDPDPSLVDSDSYRSVSASEEAHTWFCAHPRKTIAGLRTFDVQ